MKVRDIIPLLQQCHPEAEVIFNAPFQGFTSVTVLQCRNAHGGIDHRYSFEEILTVEVLSGDLAHMRGQGMNVLGMGEPDPCTCHTCHART